MKILHVIPSVSLLRGGPSVAIVAMVRAQRAIGIDAVIATTNDNGDTLLNVDTLAWSELEGVPCRYFDRWSPRVRALREFAYSNDFRRWITHHITDYDLIHVHAIFSACSSLAMHLAHKNSVPYVVRTIGLLDQWSLRQSALRKALFLKAFEHNNLKNASAIHATSNLEAQQIRIFDPSLNVETIPLGIADILGAHVNRGSIRSEIVQQPNGASDKQASLAQKRTHAQDQLKRTLNIDSTSAMLLFLARLHPKKGLEHVMSALADTAQLNTTHLLIAGSGETEYERSLQERCQRLGIAERVHFLGFLRAQEKRQAFLGCDLYVLPSASENFGISVLEALNAGLPALVSTGVALHEEVGKEALGGVIDLNGPTANLGDLIALLLEHPKELQLMGAKARRYTQDNYSWASIAATLSTLYENLIRK